MPGVRSEAVEYPDWEGEVMHAEQFVQKWSDSPWLRMAHIARFSSLPVLHKESVAEHSWFVCLFSLAIAKYIEESTGSRVDYSLLLQRAVLHDLDESLSGDFIRPFKYADAILRQHLDRVVSEGMAKALEGYPGEQQLHYFWKSAKRPDLEGFILSTADLWSVVQFAQREVRLGNSYGHRVLSEAAVWLRQLQVTVSDAGPSVPALARLSDVLRALAGYSEIDGQGDWRLRGALAAKSLEDPFERLIAEKKGEST